MHVHTLTKLRKGEEEKEKENSMYVLPGYDGIPMEHCGSWRPPDYALIYVHRLRGGSIVDRPSFVLGTYIRARYVFLGWCRGRGPRVVRPEALVAGTSGLGLAWLGLVSWCLGRYGWLGMVGYIWSWIGRYILCYTILYYICR
ncbi:hypothetical protein F5Y00DRAFT_240467 [Daldinia vernicosa]|uniref:uncharacterized protein n=1 Tax=Daldinia vernicosa TaxID=114800 RepID=UPI002008784F|nr:uncharacterized protein F5Y00DRAFT_240467 [Daldinia vernicosa]KAI0847800.1 hypothetical protein F5Y00DRAFT_240467 [Daldinia vernicosa]